MVYTALFGDIDPLWTPLPVAMRGARWVAFTDRERLSQGLWTHELTEKWPNILLDTNRTHSNVGWEVRVVGKPFGNRGTARHYKAMPPFPDADVTIWIDGNVRLRIPAAKAVRRWLGSGDLATFDHNDRHCLYDEAVFCLMKGKGVKVKLRRQVRAYQKSGMPVGWGLAETKCVIRRNTERIQRLGEAWWEQLQQFSLRDQVSLPYVCRELGLRWNVIPGRAGLKTFPGMLNHAFWYTKHQKGRSGGNQAGTENQGLDATKRTALAGAESQPV